LTIRINKRHAAPILRPKNRLKMGIKKDRLKKSAGLTTQKSNVQGKTKNI
jgi:hypothetical protein